MMIREATVEDAARIAEIDVISSRYAYKNIVPDSFLYEDMSVESRIPVHERWIAEKRFDVYVHTDPATGAVNGMMGVGACGDDDKKDAFELHYIYVDPAFVRTGIGSKLLEFFEEKGRENGCAGYVVWVLEENGIGRSFYEKHGYRSDGAEKIFKRWNKKEIRYVKG